MVQSHLHGCVDTGPGGGAGPAEDGEVRDAAGGSGVPRRPEPKVEGGGGQQAAKAAGGDGGGGRQAGAAAHLTASTIVPLPT